MSEWNEYYRPLRAILQDQDEDVPTFANNQLAAALRLVVDLGKVSGIVIDYTADDAGITPDLSPASDPQAYARLLWHAAKLFVRGLTSSSFTTRAFSQQMGQPRELIDAVIEEVYSLDNGDMAS